MNRCLVLGGTGFIGQHLCKKLKSEGNNVEVLVRNIEKHNNFLEENDLDFTEGDFTEIEDFESLLDGIDVVFHLISTTIPSKDTDIISNEIHSNIIQTVKLLEGIIKSNVKRLIFVSSGGTIYGVPEEIPIREEHPTNPTCSYGIQKLMIEKYLHLYNKIHNLDYKIIRLSNPYGVGQNIEKNQGVIPIFINKILNNETIEIWGDGSVIRDYIYIHDAIEGIIAVSMYSGEERIFNIGSGEGTSLRNIIKIILEFTQEDYKQIKFLSARNIDVKENILDIKKANYFLNWYPTYDIYEGIKKFMAEKGIEL